MIDLCKNGNFTNIGSLLDAMAKAMNLIDPDVTDHHQQTAYLSHLIAKEAGFDENLTELTVYSALLHDVGAVLLEFRTFREGDRMYERVVAKLGAGLLRGLPYYYEIAEVVDSCQLSWDEIKELLEKDHTKNPEFLRVSAVISLADFISSEINGSQGAVLDRASQICETVKKGRGTEFSEESADAFLRISELEYVWFDTVYNPSFRTDFAGHSRGVSLENALDLTQLMTRLIDYRSSFTAMHSAGVAASAMKLAELCGMTKQECLMMRIAGNLHDIGKLKVPREILEKPGRLNDHEFNVIKEHPYYTRLILDGIDGFEKITEWASFHHEKLNGKGYPFHIGKSDIDTGARIVAVADIFSAITEVRPYRAGMPKERAMKVLRENAARGDICPEIVNLLFENYEEVDFTRDRVSRAAGKRYFESLDGSVNGATA